MFRKVAQALGGDPNKKILDKYSPLIQKINQLEKEKYEKISDEELRQSTIQFRQRLSQGETLDDLLAEAFAAVREAGKRTIGLRLYDVQLIGGMVLHEGKIAEMRTGEGKTLVATLPLYLNALTGKGVHLVTVNDYLARRDARWMGPIFIQLGMSVGVLQMAGRSENAKNAYLVDLELKASREDQNQLKIVSRQEAYAADITYGTNNEFGFDYLRDNLTGSLQERVQRGHHYAIVDEVDNILVDEARTPLIISGPAADESQYYQRMAQAVKQLREGDYDFNEKDRSVALTEAGETRVEEMLGVTLRDPDRPEELNPEQARLLGYLEQVLKAKLLFKKNKDYIIQSGQVIIVDEFTGRLMPGRRWSEGLHQAVEALEGVRIKPENITYATITLQNYFRKYAKLAGMTGTAMTESEEFYSIYKLQVTSIPTNLDYLASSSHSDLMLLDQKDEQGYLYSYYTLREDADKKAIFWKRKDYPDVIYRTTEAKLRAIIQEIIRHHIPGRPLLVGTASVEHSEIVSNRLQAQPLRKLMQTLIILQSWLDQHKAKELEWIIPELTFLNEPLEKISTNEMIKTSQSLGLTSLNPDDPSNLSLLLRYFNLEEEYLSELKETIRQGIKHSVLNARNHDEESKIIANAGMLDSVMIATNMAGRGIDIKLGGELDEDILPDVMRVLKNAGKDPFNMSIKEYYRALGKIPAQQYGIYEEKVRRFQQHYEMMERVRKLGGLHVIGSEKHEARRIDNQLRGRAARQGDPGSSRFFVSWEDDLMRLFGQERKDTMMKLLKINDLAPLELGLYGRVVDQAQERVEGYNFDIRKHLLEYDDVINTQRERIYAERDKALTKPSLMEDVLEMLQSELQLRIPTALQASDGTWRLLAYLEEIQPTLPIEGEEMRIPSFKMQVILDFIKRKFKDPSKISVVQLLSVLNELGGEVLELEKSHLLAGAEAFLNKTRESYEQQLAQKMDEVDIFFEGLQMQAEEPGANPRVILNQIQTTFNIRLDFSGDQIKNILDSMEQIRETVRNQVQASSLKNLQSRIEKVYGSKLQESISLLPNEGNSDSWETIRSSVFNWLGQYIDSKSGLLFGSQGQLKQNVLAMLSGRSTVEWEDNLLLEVVSRMDEVTRLVIDPRSHKKMTRKGNLLNYLYWAGHRLENQDVEILTEQVLNHLINVQSQLQMAFGRMELRALIQSRISYEQINPFLKMRIASLISEEKYNQLLLQPQLSLVQPELVKVSGVFGEDIQNMIYRNIFLNAISSLWIEHLTHMEGLRVSIGMEAYAQRDPLVQYKSQASDAFKNLLDNIRMTVIGQMFRTRPSRSKATSAKASSPESKESSNPASFQHGKNKFKKHRHH
jgi:preprotein translocase subunit SecA